MNQRTFEIWRRENATESLTRVATHRRGANAADAVKAQAERFPSSYPDGKIVYARSSAGAGRLTAYRIKRGGLMVERA